MKSLAAKAEDEFITVKAPMEILNINGLIAAGEPARIPMFQPK